MLPEHPSFVNDFVFSMSIPSHAQEIREIIFIFCEAAVYNPIKKPNHLASRILQAKCVHTGQNVCNEELSRKLL